MSFMFDRDSNGNPIVKTSAFGYDEQMRFRGLGISGTATAGATTNIDHVLTEERYLSGGRVILEDHVLGDYASLQIVHPTYGVVDTFAENWYFSPSNDQGDIIRNYPAKLPAGLTIRIAYTSTGVTDVIVMVNLFLDKKVVPV